MSEPILTTSRQMVDLLRRHYLPEGRPPAGIFAPEIQAPSGTRRADLIFQGVTAAAGSELIGHEVKVSRADVLTELDDLAKSDPWQRYCDRWWLVVPHEALVNGLTLPASWGVLTPPSGRRRRSMTVLVPAPKLNPVDQAPAYRTLATWLHWRHDKRENELAQEKREADRLRVLNGQLRDRLPRDSPELAAEERVLREIVRKLGGPDGLRSTRIGQWDRSVDVDDVVVALLDLGMVYRHAQTVGYRVESTLRSVQEALRGLEEVPVAELKQAVKRFTDPAPIVLPEDGA